MKNRVPTKNTTEQNAPGGDGMWTIPIVQYIKKVERSDAQRYKRYRAKASMEENRCRPRQAPKFYILSFYIYNSRMDAL